MVANTSTITQRYLAQEGGFSSQAGHMEEVWKDWITGVWNSESSRAIIVDHGSRYMELGFNVTQLFAVWTPNVVS